MGNTAASKEPSGHTRCTLLDLTARNKGHDESTPQTLRCRQVFEQMSEQRRAIRLRHRCQRDAGGKQNGRESECAGKPTALALIQRGIFARE